MRVALKDGYIAISNMTSQEYNTIREWNLTKYVRSEQALKGIVTLDLLDNLAQLTRLPPDLATVRARLHDRDAEIQALRAEPEPTPLYDYPVKRKLFKHQIRGANMAMVALTTPYFKHKGFGLLFSMGAGKSLTAIAVAGALYQQKRISKVLVVAPTSVCGVWPDELEKGAEFDYAVTVLLGDKQKRLTALAELDAMPTGLKVASINYESVWRPEIMRALLRWQPDMIIADESQRIKSPSAAQSKAMHALGDMATYKLILSGTPVQNAAIDLWSQYRFLDKKVFGENFYAFRNRYAIMGGFEKHQIIGYRHLDELIRKEYSVAYRVTKEEALDLPEQTFENRYVDLDGKTMEIYKKLKRDSVAELSSEKKVTASTVLTKLIRLQQLAGGFLTTDDSVVPTHVHNSKLNALMDIIEDADGKVVVFARFTAEIDLIAETLRKAKIRFGLIDGRTPMVRKGDKPCRDDIVREFQEDEGVKVFVAQIQTAGLGITLHAASVAVFYSMDYNYANYQQAAARIHRIGQRNVCTYYHLVARGTVDEKVLRALDAKEDLAKRVVDNWREYFE